MCEPRQAGWCIAVSGTMACVDDTNSVKDSGRAPSAIFLKRHLGRRDIAHENFSSASKREQA